MKTKFLFSVLIYFISSPVIQAQWINSVTVFPANPVDTDTIYIYANVDFPSGPCDDKTISSSSVPPNLYANVLHCLGPLTYICNDIDTIVYYQLPAGNYTFTYQVDAGGSPSPCTPGIVPGPSQTISFTVSVANSIEETGKPENFILYPNPVSDYLLIPAALTRKLDGYKIYDSSGKLIVSGKIKQNAINVSEFATGNYIINFEKSGEEKINYRFTITR
jgi:hypothetical protein